MILNSCVNPWQPMVKSNLNRNKDLDFKNIYKTAVWDMHVSNSKTD